jgi:hypothetical protein
MPADGLTPISFGHLRNRSMLRMAIDTVRDREQCLAKLQIPQRPPMIADMTPAKIDALKGNAVYADLRTAWNNWQVAYSTAIADNRARLRGALWAHRELAKEPENAEAKEAKRKLEVYLAKEWGCFSPPSDRLECAQLADDTAMTHARALKPRARNDGDDMRGST